MKNNILCSIVLLSLFLCCAGLQAQRVSIEARIDSTVLWIGEQTPLTFEVTQPAQTHIDFPLFSDEIPGGLDIVENLKIDTIKSGDNITVSHRYIVTAFEDSLFYIPPFPFVVQGEDTVWSKSLSLKVIQPFELDMESNTITDIKNIYKPKYNWGRLIMIFLLTILIIALIVALIIIFRKYIQKKPVLPTTTPIPQLPAHIVALEELNRIKDEKLWQKERYKEYYTELTDVLRVYIGRVFDINAMEMTSEEILDNLLHLRRNQQDSYQALHNILRLADLVKFAKWKPLNDESERSLKEAFLFVENTKIEEEINPTEEPVTTPSENE